MLHVRGEIVSLAHEVLVADAFEAGSVRIPDRQLDQHDLTPSLVRPCSLRHHIRPISARFKGFFGFACHRLLYGADSFIPREPETANCGLSGEALDQGVLTMTDNVFPLLEAPFRVLGYQISGTVPLAPSVVLIHQPSGSLASLVKLLWRLEGRVVAAFLDPRNAEESEFEPASELVAMFGGKMRFECLPISRKHLLQLAGLRDEVAATFGDLARSTKVIDTLIFRIQEALRVIVEEDIHGPILVPARLGGHCILIATSDPFLMKALHARLEQDQVPHIQASRREGGNARSRVS
jgi:hypothetical protein